MKKIISICILLQIFCILTAYAQKQINIRDVQIINLGDGQQYIHELGDREKPINGKIRLITGVTSEYTDGAVKDGYFEGKWDYYANNILKQSLNFKDGYLEGKQYYYFPNGDPEYEATFKKGIKNGDWLYYSRDGGKREQITYIDNKMSKKVTYYTNGNVDMERNFKNGKEHGATKTFTQEGVLKSDKNYVDGKQVGKQFILMSSNIGNFYRYSNYNNKGNLEGAYSEEWEETKKPKEKGQYIDGKKDGKWTKYNIGGVETSSETYKNGVFQY